MSDAEFNNLYFQKLFYNCTPKYFFQQQQGFTFCLNVSPIMSKCDANASLNDCLQRPDIVDRAKHIAELRHKFLQTNKSPQKLLNTIMQQKPNMGLEERIMQVDTDCEFEADALEKCIKSNAENQEGCFESMLQFENCAMNTTYGPLLRGCVERKPDVDPLIALSQCLFYSPSVRINLHSIHFAYSHAKELQELIDPSWDISNAVDEKSLEQVSERLSKYPFVQDQIVIQAQCVQQHGETSDQCVNEHMKVSNITTVAYCGNRVKNCMRNGGSFVDCLTSDEVRQCSEQVDKVMKQ